MEIGFVFHYIWNFSEILLFKENVHNPPPPPPPNFLILILLSLFKISCTNPQYKIQINSFGIVCYIMIG